MHPVHCSHPKAWTREIALKCSQDRSLISSLQWIQLIQSSVFGFSWISWDKKHACRSPLINCISLNKLFLNFLAFSIHWDLFGRPSARLTIRFLCKHTKSTAWHHFLNLHWNLIDARNPILIQLMSGEAKFGSYRKSSGNWSTKAKPNLFKTQEGRNSSYVKISIFCDQQYALWHPNSLAHFHNQNDAHWVWPLQQHYWRLAY